METVAFLESLVDALGRGWSARYAVIAPYGVFGVVLTCDAGGSVEVVPSFVRGAAVTWSPFAFTRGVPHYDLHVGGELLRTRQLGEAVERLQRWRMARAPGDRLTRIAARMAATRARRGAVSPARRRR